jgi:hypothetical protein
MTIPVELIDELDLISSTLNVSRSSLVTEILQEAVKPLAEVINLSIAMVEDTSGTDAATLRRNPQKVREYLDALRQAVDVRKKTLDDSMTQYLLQLGADHHEH